MFSKERYIKKDTMIPAISQKIVLQQSIMILYYITISHRVCFNAGMWTEGCQYFNISKRERELSAKRRRITLKYNRHLESCALCILYTLHQHAKKWAHIVNEMLKLEINYYIWRRFDTWYIKQTVGAWHPYRKCTSITCSSSKRMLKALSSRLSRSNGMTLKRPS